MLYPLGSQKISLDRFLLLCLGWQVGHAKGPVPIILLSMQHLHSQCRRCLTSPS